MVAGTNVMDSDTVRANTAPAVNQKIDEQMRDRILLYANKSNEEITRRIQELDQEWDIERMLEMNAATVSFTGLVFGTLFGKKWLLLPTVALPFLFLHAYQGWCPPLPVLRRFNVRTRREIDAEKYALRLLRGDFEGLDKKERALKALEPELSPIEP